MNTVATQDAIDPVMPARYRLPIALTGLRAALAPVMVALAFVYPSRVLLGLCLVAALVSDILDGALARRWGIATPRLSRLDSAADTLFYLAATLCLWWLSPTVVARWWRPLQILLVLESLRYALDFAKFRQQASYHMWSSKAWGLFLFIGFYWTLALRASSLPLGLAIFAGILSDIEGLAISLILRYPTTDVPTLLHALKRRCIEPSG